MANPPPTSFAIDTTLSGGLKFVQQTLQAIAIEKARDLYGAGYLKSKPVVVVDGNPRKDVADVKPFGSIVFVPSLGPVKEAMALAWQVVQRAAPHRTGHYQNSFMWYVNGKPRGSMGPPDVAKLGPRANVQLADLAPYAAMAEIQVPSGVLYAAYVAVRAAYGTRLNVGFSYRKPAAPFLQNDGGANAQQRKRPLAVPVLDIGGRGSTARRTGRKPGRNVRRRKKAARIARRAGK